jgi:CubicO group peptidase (beta-lactamase class C family)
VSDPRPGRPTSALSKASAQSALAASLDARNWVDPPHNRLGFLRVAALARTRRISRGSGPIVELPRAERDLAAFAFRFEDGDLPFTTMLEETYTDGLLVLHDGAVVAERYAGSMTADDTHLLMSVSKSIASTLCGIYVHRGLLGVDDLVTDHLKELAGTAWEGCTIQHLLDMRAGVRWDYETDEIDILDVSDYRENDRSDLPKDTASWIRSIDGSMPHGRAFRYISLASDLLGWVLESVGGAEFSQLVSREIWSALGAERDAEIIVDAAGFAVVEGGMCATLRDVGRFGQLCLDGGILAGREIIPGGWLDRLRDPEPELIQTFAQAPESDPALPKAFYHNNWWIEDARAGIYSGLGIYGQTLLIHHPTRTVVVKLSSHPAPEDPTLWRMQRAGLMALCESLV